MAKSSKKEKELICFTHENIIAFAISICDIDFENIAIKDIRSTFTEIRKTAKEIEGLAKKAKERGQVMENRLREYRDAIEALGFKREKE